MSAHPPLRQYTVSGWYSKFDLQLHCQCDGMHMYLSRSISEIQLAYCWEVKSKYSSRRSNIIIIINNNNNINNNNTNKTACRTVQLPHGDDSDDDYKMGMKAMVMKMNGGNDTITPLLLLPSPSSHYYYHHLCHHHCCYCCCCCRAIEMLIMCQ